MPPKPKHMRKEIAAAAFEIIGREGLAALTAKNLGRRLGCSPSSIFTVLPNMEAVKLAARELALEEFKEYISNYMRKARFAQKRESPQSRVMVCRRNKCRAGLTAG